MAEAIATVALFLHSVVIESHLLAIHGKPFWNVLLDGDLNDVAGGVKSPTVFDVTANQTRLMVR